MYENSRYKMYEDYQNVKIKMDGHYRARIEQKCVHEFGRSLRLMIGCNS